MSPSSPNLKEDIVHESAHESAEVVPAWKQELNERLAATRSRRLRIRGEQVALPGLEDMENKANSRAAKLAAKVARRYENAPSYSEVLAAESRARAEKTEAAQRVTDISPIPIPIRRFADELERSNDPRPLGAVKAEPVVLASAAAAAAIPAETEDLVVFDEIEPLPANVIDFPRELVAARRVRPRLAEGPLSQAPENAPAQLRVFEVAPETISQTASIGPAKDWSPIRLDSPPDSSAQGMSQSLAQEIPLKPASLEDRMMAAIFDFALVVAAFALFILVFAACTSHPPTGKPALLGAGLVLGGFCMLYQFLFFRFAAGTPGMRYAKIALCTFDDENPTRKAMCRRVWFLLLSAAPLGLGFTWAWFDTDRLSWHDRMARVYQRSYSS